MKRAAQRRARPGARGPSAAQRPAEPGPRPPRRLRPLCRPAAGGRDAGSARAERAPRQPAAPSAKGYYPRPRRRAPGNLGSASSLQPFSLSLLPQLFLRCIFSLVPSLAPEALQVYPTHAQFPNPCFSFFFTLFHLLFKPKNLGHNKNIESLPIPQIFVESTWCHFARLLFIC